MELSNRAAVAVVAVVMLAVVALAGVIAVGANVSGHDHRMQSVRCVQVGGTWAEGRCMR